MMTKFDSYDIILLFRLVVYAYVIVVCCVHCVCDATIMYGE